MEAILTFVLGALSGLFLVGIVYTFIGVLKITKSVKFLKTEIQNIHDKMESNNRHIDERFNSVHNNMCENYDDLYKFNNATRHEIAGEIKGMSQYIDSRLDKTIQTIYNRMDVLFVKKDKEQQINS